ncbi:SNARE domain protein [Ancylostoma ceylanicum]|uniref:SNARE domain protein n=1 Tax=Ancylostoma ceylanicum TaxID=53326 RepID=A0A0D6LWE7_9BILA|nr:SNARE domain protein [Ancylostoma ceylanicum]
MQSDVRHHQKLEAADDDRIKGPSTSNNYESSYLERHNDSLVDELSSKVAALKKVTISIGEDVREQNRLLNTMDDDFDSSKGLLMSTMKRLGISIEGVNQGKKTLFEIKKSGTSPRYAEDFRVYN